MPRSVFKPWHQSLSFGTNLRDRKGQRSRRQEANTMQSRWGGREEAQPTAYLPHLWKGRTWAPLPPLSPASQLFSVRTMWKLPQNCHRTYFWQSNWFFPGACREGAASLRVSDWAEWKSRFVLLGGKLEENWQRLQQNPWEEEIVYALALWGWWRSPLL